MLFTPEPVRRRRAEIARECQAGEITELEAGVRLTEADPDFGGGYILLGNGRAAAGDLAEAESCYWKALDRMPCDYTPYLVLSDIRKKKQADHPLSQHLVVLGLWKLALSEQIPDEVAGIFRKRMENVHFDFKDPTTYEALAVALAPKGDAAADIRDRLLSYELLNDLQRQSSEGMSARLLRDTLAQAECSIPLWRAALREWADGRSKLPPDALGLMTALLGETAGPEILDDLLELACLSQRTVFLHSNWAIWRVGQRFPAEALAKFREAAANAPHLRLRCALADHVYLMPEIPGIEAVLTGLLEGFASFAGEEDAAYLLATVTEGLYELERDGEAERVFEQFQGLLPAPARQWLRDRVDEGFIPKLVDEEIEDLTIEEVCSDRFLMDEDEEEGLPEEEEEEAIPPVVAPVRPGRNEPCWCGSGKKYKKCHLAADEEEERSHRTEEPAAQSLHERLQAALMERILEWHSAADNAEAKSLYFGQRPEEIDPQLDEETLVGFFEWCIHDFRPTSTGRTMVEEYLRRRTGQLAAAERELLEAWREARFGIWEVERVEEGKGVELKDLFEGDHFFVDDVSCSRTMVRWDCVLCRIYRSEERWYFAGNGLTVPRTLLPVLTEKIERESQEAGETAAAFVRANSHRWHRVAGELADDQLAALRVVNAEGDELEFCAAEYRVEDQAALVPALEAATPFEAQEKGEGGVWSFGWLEQNTGEPRRSYGHIEIRGGKLRLECNSRKRLAIGRQLVEKHGGDWLRHKGDSFESLDAVKRRALDRKRPRKAGKRSDLPREAEREIVLKLKTEHYARWVDEPLPALEGRTPREAARSEAGRRALEDLLRTMENSEEHARGKGDAAFDFSVVRKSLGI